MALPPRRIRNLPPALPAKDTDVFPISQVDEEGVATTRAMTRAQNNAEMIGVISEARQEFVDMAEVEHDRLEAKIDAKADAPVKWTDVTEKPTSFPPSAHSQAISTVTGLQSALDAKVQPRISRFTGTTVSTGISTIAFSPAYSTPPDVDVVEAWNGDQMVTGAVIPGTITASGCQVQVMVSRGTLLLTSGPFAKAGAGVSVTVRAIGN